MTSRERVLWEIAERYTDLIEPLASADIRGDGNTAGILLMPATYTPTVREFERLMRLMGQDRSEPLVPTPAGKVSVRALHWHITHWHIDAIRTIKHEPVTAKKHRKATQLRHPDGTPVTRPTIKIIRDRNAREPLARAGIAWIAQHWGLATEPMLPKEILEQQAA